MINPTLRDCNKLLKKKKAENTEATRKGKKFYCLHICSNGNPVPEFVTEDVKELYKYIEIDTLHD